MRETWEELHTVVGKTQEPSELCEGGRNRPVVYVFELTGEDGEPSLSELVT